LNGSCFVVCGFDLEIGSRLVMIFFCVLLNADCNKATQITLHKPHVTLHNSHAARHTSHAARHTSHVTRHTSQILPVTKFRSLQRASDTKPKKLRKSQQACMHPAQNNRRKFSKQCKQKNPRAFYGRGRGGGGCARGRGLLAALEQLLRLEASSEAAMMMMTMMMTMLAMTAE